MTRRAERMQPFGEMLKEFTATLQRIADQAYRLIAGDQGALDPAQAEDVRIILQASTRLFGLVTQLADRGDEPASMNEAGARLIAKMSHDLRSPLNSVIGFADLLLQGMEGPLSEDQRGAIQLIADEAQTLMKFIARQSQAIDG